MLWTCTSATVSVTDNDEMQLQWLLVQLVAAIAQTMLSQALAGIRQKDLRAYYSWTKQAHAAVTSTPSPATAMAASACAPITFQNRDAKSSAELHIHKSCRACNLLLIPGKPKTYLISTDQFMPESAAEVPACIPARANAAAPGQQRRCSSDRCQC